MTVSHYIQISGPLGILALLISVVLTCLGIYWLAVASARRRFLQLAAMAFLPIFVGLWGTYFSVVKLQKTMEEERGLIDYTKTPYALAETRYPTHLGLIGSLPPFALAWLGIYRTRPKP